MPAIEDGAETCDRPGPVAAEWGWLAAMLLLGLVIALTARTAGYLFPPTGPSVASLAYVTGFSNRAATLTVWAMLIITGLVAVAWRGRRRAGLDGTPIRPPTDHRQIAAVTVLLCLLTALVMVGIWYLMPSLTQYAEARYPLRRTDLVLSYGLLPYRDLDYGYGPLLICTSVAISWLAQAVGLPLALGYVLAVLVITCLGYVALAAIAHRLRVPRAVQVLLYALAALGFMFNFVLGTHSGPLRCALPWLMLLLLHRSVAELTRPTVERIVRQVVLTATGSLLTWGIAPEAGIIWMGGHLVYEADRLLGRDTAAWLRLAGSALGFVILLAAVSTRYFGLLLAYTEGGLSFPLEPTPAVVLYMALLAALVTTLTPALWRQGATPRRSLHLALLAMAFAAAPVALGRCDVFHVAVNGLVPMLLALVILWRRSPRLFAPVAVVWVVVFNLALGVAALANYDYSLGPIKDAWLGQQTKRSGADILEQLKPLNLDRHDRLATPIDTDPQLERWLRDTGRFVPFYYPDHYNITNTATLEDYQQRLIREQVLLIPARLLTFTEEQAFGPATPAEMAGWSASTSKVMLYPVRLRAVNMPFRWSARLGLFIQEHYQPVAAAHGHAVVIRKDALPSRVRP